MIGGVIYGHLILTKGHPSVDDESTSPSKIEGCHAHTSPLPKGHTTISNGGISCLHPHIDEESPHHRRWRHTAPSTMERCHPCHPHQRTGTTPLNGGTLPSTMKGCHTCTPTSMMNKCQTCTPHQQWGYPLIGDGGVSCLFEHINYGGTPLSNMEAPLHR